MAELEMLKLLQAQILTHAFQAFKDSIDIKRLTGIQMQQPEKRNAQKAIFREAQRLGKAKMHGILEEHLDAIKTKTKETALFSTVADIIRESCNSHADAYFEALESAQMHEIETIWRLENEMKALDDHVAFLRKSEAELSQHGISEMQRNALRNKIKKELEERNEKLRSSSDETAGPPSEKVMNQFTEELEKCAKKKDLTLENMTPALRALVEEMNQSFNFHNYVYPPAPKPGTIRLPIGGLANCCCSPNCPEKLMEPAYLDLGGNPGDDRWRLDDVEPPSSQKAQQNRRKKKK